MKRRSRFLLAGFASTLAAALAIVPGCSSTYPQRNPTGEVLPSVVGTSLEGEEVRLPEDMSGEPAVLLIGYEQRTQFDLDRWLLGMQQAGMRVRAYEVPTIPGFWPGLFQNSIDSGMQRGIPEEDWASVVTLYSDAPEIARFTGNENGMPGRILLLDGEGRVAFFHDRGYSAGSLGRLQAALAELRD